MHVKTVYVCERCGEEHDYHKWIFRCLGGCGTEICEHCMCTSGHRQECAKKYSDAEMTERYEAMYGIKYEAR